VRRLLSIVAALPACAGLAAQQAPTFSSRVEMVRVDVLATENGRPLLGLGPDDFEIFDNGVRQDITLIGFDDVPLSVLLTVDLSASVEGTRLDNLRSAGRALLDGLRPEDAAGLIAFNHAVSRLRAQTSSFDEVRAALDRAQPSGGTSLIDATYASVVMTESDTRRSLVVLFSDGLDTTSWLTEKQAIDGATRSQAIVYAVAVAQQRSGPKFLSDVTNTTGGRLLEVERIEDLSAAFVSVLREFRQRYLLSYTPHGVDTPGWHALEVRVRRRGVDVRARSGYVR